MKFRRLLTLSLLYLSSIQLSYADNIAFTEDNQAWQKSAQLTIDDMNISGIALNDAMLALVSDESNAVVILKTDSKGQWQPYRTIPLSSQADEIDLEGLVWQPPYLYALGSHSAKRKKLKANLSQKQNLKRLLKTSPENARQQLFRIKLDKQFKPEQITSLSLQPLLQQHPILSKFIGIPSKENGIDIEGLAIDNKGRLMIGFRGPLLRGNIAVILRLELKKNKFAIKKSKTLYLPTNGGGIRGISEMDKSFLVLTGAVGDQAQNYQIFIWNGKNALPGKDVDRKTLKKLCTLPQTEGKAEGIQFLSQTKNQVEFLVVQDGLRNGAVKKFTCRQ